MLFMWHNRGSAVAQTRSRNHAFMQSLWCVLSVFRYSVDAADGKPVVEICCMVCHWALSGILAFCIILALRFS